MAKTLQEAYTEIKAFINKQGKPYTEWYAGIASEPEERLFEEHNVTEAKSDWWIYRECSDEQSARAVKETLIKLGCDGDSGGGDYATVYAYAYLKSANTKP